MDTKWGLTLLIGGGYLLGLGIAGINFASSGGIQAVYALVLVAGVISAGWSMVLPWNGGKPRPDHVSPGPVPRS